MPLQHAAEVLGGLLACAATLINLKTAKSTGLKIPQSPLLRAGEVIE